MESYHRLRWKEQEIKDQTELKAILAKTCIGRIDIDFLSGKRTGKNGSDKQKQ